MKILKKHILSQSKKSLWSEGEPLTQSLFRHEIEAADPAGVIKSLAAYQNPDGGFGHNLEGDFELPDSSPMATSVGFQILLAVNASSQDTLVQGGIKYLLNTYRPERKGWITIPPQVNNYPHASWWHYLESEGGSVIDHNWGNPSAELVGVLMHYRQLVPDDFLEPLYQHTLKYLQDYPGKMEMHELFCFLRLAEEMPRTDFEALKNHIIQLVMDTVTIDPAGWESYSAQPLDFATSPDSFLYAPLRSAVETNLDTWIDQIQPNGTWLPNWSWQDYPQAWEKAKRQIAGRLTVRRLKILKSFNRLEG